MTWRDDLRPASFRGVPFEAVDHSERGGLRGHHHVYPGQDQGWVEQLGREDGRIMLRAHVIGDDYFAQRDALIEALNEPGPGELVHPWRGSMQVVVDPHAGWRLFETSRSGRIARFSLSFVTVCDEALYPTEATDGVAATDEAGDALEDTAIEVFGERIDLGGIVDAVDDVLETVDTVVATIDRARAFVRRVAAIPGQVVATVLRPISAFRGLIRSVFALGDAFGGLGALFEGVAQSFSGRSRASSTLSLPGQRPAARPPVFGGATGDPAEAETVARAVLAALDRDRGAPPADPRLAANRAAFDAALDAVLLSELARATVRRAFDSHDLAISAMRDLDARIETAIRTESDRADGSDQLVLRLGDLRATAREHLLTTAADIAPLVSIDLPGSLPALAIAWRLDGHIDSEADIIARNGVRHPLFGPVTVSHRLEAGNA